MITFGDQKIVPHGVFDEGDGFEAPIGTLKATSRNVMKTNLWSWKRRGGFTNDVALPTQLNLQSDYTLTSNISTGTNSGLTFVKPLYFTFHKVLKPESKTIRFLVGLFSFDADGTTVYMKRYLMYPFFDGSVFQNYWKDITPYLIDLVILSPPVSISGSNEYTVDATSATPNAIPYLAADLSGAYVYLEDGLVGDASNVFGSFAAKTMHLAEGDKITSGEYLYSSAEFNFFTETASHPTWDDGVDNLRIHKNLETGRIPYGSLCALSQGDLDSASFSHVVIGETLVLFERPGDISGFTFDVKTALQLQLSFEKKTLFHVNGVVRSRADFVYTDTSDLLYDKHLVKGFPNSGHVGTLVGKFVRRWATGVTPSSTPIGSGSAYSSAYDPITGKLTLGSGFTASDLRKNLYEVNGVDLQVTINNFVLTEFDLHGRFGSHMRFGDYLSDNPFTRFLESPATALYSFSGYNEATAASNGIVKTGTEIPFTPQLGYIGDIDILTAGTGYAINSHLPIAFTGGIPRVPDVSIDEGSSSARRYSGRSPNPSGNGNRTLPTVPENTPIITGDLIYGNAVAFAVTNGAGVVSSIVIEDPGDSYSEIPVATVLGGSTTAATLEAKVYKDKMAIFAASCARHSGFRYGFHSSSVLTVRPEIYDTIATAFYSSKSVLGLIQLIPAQFNRTCDGGIVCLQPSDSSFATSGNYHLRPLDAKGIFFDDWKSSNWVFYLATVANSSGDLGPDEFVYARFHRIDRSYYMNNGIAGNHLQVTGNPDFSKNLSNPSITNSFLGDIGFEMAGDYTFGPLSACVARDRLFAVRAKYGEVQRSVSAYVNYTEFESSNQMFFSTIGQFGGNYHLFAASSTQRVCAEIGNVIAVTSISNEGSETVVGNRTSVLTLGEDGFIMWDLADNVEDLWIPASSKTDCCVSRRSVTTHNGKAFYAGMTGVYMFDGQKQVEITRLGQCSVKSTWNTFTKAQKQESVGAFHVKNNQYWLHVFGTKSLLFIFDFNYNEIYIWESVIGFVGFGFDRWMSYMDGEMYFLGYGLSTALAAPPPGVHVLVRYDETQATDYLPSIPEDIATDLELNNIKPTYGVAKIDFVSCGYSSSSNGMIEAKADDVSLGSRAIASASKLVEFKTNPQANARGRRFSARLNWTSGIPEIFDINIKVSDIHQLRLIKNSLIMGSNNAGNRQGGTEN